jgi:threonine dehydrogenase-like Zn-dependent dehydrogenase
MSIGFCRDTGGTWGEVFVAHQSQLYRVPDGVNDLNALMVEPFSSGLHPVLRNFPGDDETVLILGAGAIGLCVLAALRSLGSRSRVLVLARYRFQVEAAEKLGASEVIPVSRGIDVFEKVAERTGARVMKPMVGRRIMVGGVDRTFECIGSTISIDNALRMTRAGGRAVLVGMPGTARLDWSSIFVKELEICASLAYHRAEEHEGVRQSTFEIAFSLMQQGKVNLDWMVTHTFSLCDYKRAFEMLTHKGRHSVIKTAFVFDR